MDKWEAKDNCMKMPVNTEKLRPGGPDMACPALTGSVPTLGRRHRVSEIRPEQVLNSGLRAYFKTQSVVLQPLLGQLRGLEMKPCVGGTEVYFTWCRMQTGGCTLV